MRISDWSSDVCSSDLVLRPFFLAIVTQHSGVDESRCGRQLRLHGQQMDLLRRACRGQLGDHETDGGERRVRPIDRNQDAHGVRGWPGRVLAGTLAAGAWDRDTCDPFDEHRSEEHTSELQSLMRISYAVFCLK